MLGRIGCVMVTSIKICCSKESFKVVSGSKIWFSELKEKKWESVASVKAVKIHKMQGTRFT